MQLQMHPLETQQECQCLLSGITKLMTGQLTEWKTQPHDNFAITFAAVAQNPSSLNEELSRHSRNLEKRSLQLVPVFASDEMDDTQEMAMPKEIQPRWCEYIG